MVDRHSHWTEPRVEACLDVFKSYTGTPVLAWENIIKGSIINTPKTLDIWYYSADLSFLAFLNILLFGYMGSLSGSVWV